MNSTAVTVLVCVAIGLVVVAAALVINDHTTCFHFLNTKGCVVN